MRKPTILLPLFLASLALGSAHAVQPKAQQLATFKVAALARVNVSDVAFRAADLQPETVTIAGDYLYKRDLQAKAYDLDAFLKARIPNVEELAAEGAQIMFWCIDGYAPMARLSDVLGKGGLIAVADAQAPADVRWPDAPYKDTVLKADAIGNYVVWRTAQFPAKPQPWGLETIYILPKDASIKK
ncbi:hypothetical protein [Deinococcus hopiensis]|uniref:Rhodanese domain-containing protein n=1 Tax=Deinococcus hopiensis KR-140 TaxID=695939 RepID=A0A1W1UJG2_9DEIO|nr:hypothetical protein [Deinococcus hopiensis]SMB81182.1 hypothetical protein SAMN00790413_04494 [Deinococcus hopiensis KR-140]